MTAHKKLMIVLIASLSANLFAVGLGAGLLINKPTRPPFKELNVHEFERLPPDVRKQNREAFQKHRLTIRNNHKAITKARRELLAEITQEPLNKEKIKQLFDQIQIHQTNNIQLSQEAFYETLIKMPLDMRKRYAERLMSPKRPHR